MSCWIAVLSNLAVPKQKQQACGAGRGRTIRVLHPFVCRDLRDVSHGGAKNVRLHDNDLLNKVLSSCHVG